jgi:PPK2 family polyphosphate:nucleotide phosphotransferase
MPYLHSSAFICGPESFFSELLKRHDCHLRVNGRIRTRFPRRTPPTRENSVKDSSMRNLLKRLVVKPESRIGLRDLDPGFDGHHESHEAAQADIQSRVQKMDQLQYLMYSERKHSLLIVLEGLDAGGKDGVIRHLLTGMNPSGCKVTGFKQPTSEELSHDFLWRIHPHVPEKGEVAIFNRSHYEDVLVVRVHELVPPAVWSKRYDLINNFEKELVEENGTTILKFFLYISKEEQLARFKQRLDEPSRRWKISASDYKERKYWDRYIAAFEDMLHKTSTSTRPGTSFRPITNGFAIWPCHTSSITHWKN